MVKHFFEENKTWKDLKRIIKNILDEKQKSRYEKIIEIQALLDYQSVYFKKIYKYDTLTFETLKYIKNLEEIKKKLEFIKNRYNQGASKESINKMAIDFINYYLTEEYN